MKLENIESVTLKYKTGDEETFRQVHAHYINTEDSDNGAPVRYFIITLPVEGFDAAKSNS